MVVAEVHLAVIIRTTRAGPVATLVLAGEKSVGASHSSRAQVSASRHS